MQQRFPSVVYLVVYTELYWIETEAQTLKLNRSPAHRSGGGSTCSAAIIWPYLTVLSGRGSAARRSHCSHLQSQDKAVYPFSFFQRAMRPKVSFWSSVFTFIVGNQNTTVSPPYAKAFQRSYRNPGNLNTTSVMWKGVRETNVWEGFLGSGQLWRCRCTTRGYFLKFSSTSGWLHAFSINTCFCLHHASRLWFGCPRYTFTASWLEYRACHKP